MLSDTAGRPWRSGQTDFALGAAGVEVLDDLRGATDADGRALAVTSRAIADELAAAADLVKGKADAVPVALVRGAGAWVGSEDGAGAAALVRTGREDWFGYGHAEAVRASLGVEPGSPAADECGIAAVHPEPVGDRIGRAVRVALHDLPDVGRRRRQRRRARQRRRPLRPGPGGRPPGGRPVGRGAASRADVTARRLEAVLAISER